ncbi:MFS transporter [Nocardioides sp. TF02-7]|uniref:MFS transporter n=1 Tax=Nocardioides sp. TF02-7 TaxID=2917724 RepID=UPI001F0577C2|nr:MFS transporter [Nocardioides sp. TF02-7]UMG91912.1 MFS transporter [Nocardioides sp. TF02-7]
MTNPQPGPIQVARNPVLAVVALCFGGLAAATTQTMVIPLQSELPLLLDATPADTAWVVTITLLTAAVSMPLAGRLADMFGKQRVLVVNAVTLLAGSAVCALSDTLLPMLVGRGLQGAAMGFIPVAISLVREIVPPRLATTSVAAMSATLGVGGAIGLPLSAWIAEAGDWHALFWIAAGLAALVTAAAVFLVPHVHDAHRGRLDVPGVVGLAVGLVTLLVGISKASTWGWGDARTVGAIVAGVVVLVVWGAYELRQDEPIVDLRTSAQRPVLLTNLAAVAIGFGMMAQSIVVPQLLQAPTATGYGLGQSILEAGLWMAPGGLVMMLLSPVSGALIGRAGAKATLVLGAVLLGGGYLVAFALMGAAWQLMIASCIAAAAVGIGYAAMPTLILDAVPPREAGAAVGLNSLMRSFGTTLSAAIMATVLTSDTQPLGSFEVPTEHAFQLCFLVGAVAAFVGAAIALGIPRRAEEPQAAGAPSAAVSA